MINIDRLLTLEKIILSLHPSQESAIVYSFTFQYYNYYAYLSNKWQINFI